MGSNFHCGLPYKGSRLACLLHYLLSSYMSVSPLFSACKSLLISLCVNPYPYISVPCMPTSKSCALSDRSTIVERTTFLHDNTL